MLIAIPHKKLLIEFHLRCYANVISIVTPIVFPYQVVFVGCHEHDMSIKNEFSDKVKPTVLVSYSLNSFGLVILCNKDFGFFFFTFVVFVYDISNSQCSNNSK